MPEGRSRRQNPVAAATGAESASGISHSGIAKYPELGALLSVTLHDQSLATRDGDLGLLDLGVGRGELEAVLSFNRHDAGKVLQRRLLAGSSGAGDDADLGENLFDVHTCRPQLLGHRIGVPGHGDRDPLAHGNRLLGLDSASALSRSLDKTRPDVG